MSFLVDSYLDNSLEYLLGGDVSLLDRADRDLVGGCRITGSGFQKFAENLVAIGSMVELITLIKRLDTLMGHVGGSSVTNFIQIAPRNPFLQVGEERSAA